MDLQKVLYSVCEKKPNIRSSDEEKEAYQSKIDALISRAKRILSYI